MPSDEDKSIASLEKCIHDVKIWMNTNKLKLNDSKTELLMCQNSRNTKEESPVQMNVNDNIIEASHKVKNLGVLLDSNLTMSAQIGHLVQSMYFQLHKIASIRKFLTESATKTLVTTLILSRLDYCNSLLSGISKDKLSKLQVVQNHAAKLVKQKKKADHVTPLLIDLHWLPVKERIDYKIALICYKCFTDTAPDYLKDLIQTYTPTRALRSSSDKFMLKKPTTNYKMYGERSFSYYGPLIWNDLPLSIRSAQTVSSFKKRLKHYLFKKAFNL